MFQQSEQKQTNRIHVFRRTFASNLLKTGASVSLIASALGHTDNSAVDRYLSVEDEKMKKCALSITEIEYKGGLY